jgi:hypothetical protein
MRMPGEEAPMCKTPRLTRSVIPGVLALLLLLVAPGAAVAGEYSVAACQADALGFSTRAFDDFASQRRRRTRTSPDLPTKCARIRGVWHVWARFSGRVATIRELRSKAETEEPPRLQGFFEWS